MHCATSLSLFLINIIRRFHLLPRSFAEWVIVCLFVWFIFLDNFFFFTFITTLLYLFMSIQDLVFRFSRSSFCSVFPSWDILWCHQCQYIFHIFLSFMQPIFFIQFIIHSHVHSCIHYFFFSFFLSFFAWMYFFFNFSFIRQCPARSLLLIICFFHSIFCMHFSFFSSVASFWGTCGRCSGMMRYLCTPNLGKCMNLSPLSMG